MDDQNLSGYDGQPREAIFLLFGLLGDVLTRTPFIREFKRRFPDVKITCIVDLVGGEVLENAPNIDKLIVVSRNKKQKLLYLLGKIIVLFSLILKRYDVFVDLYDGPSTKVLSRLSRSRVKLALGQKPHIALGARRLIDKLPYANPNHLANSALEIMSYFWRPTVNLDPRPLVDLSSQSMPQEEKRYLDHLIKTYPKFFVLSRGAGHGPKCIPLDTSEEICTKASEHYGLMPFIVNNPGQESLQAELSKALHKKGVSHVALSPLRLASLLYLFQKASFLSVPDSGLLHLGAATNAPILAIFTITPPEEVWLQDGRFIVYDLRLQNAAQTLSTTIAEKLRILLV